MYIFSRQITVACKKTMNTITRPIWKRTTNYKVRKRRLSFLTFAVKNCSIHEIDASYFRRQFCFSPFIISVLTLFIFTDSSEKFCFEQERVDPIGLITV